jgi:hypothetical protein
MVGAAAAAAPARCWVVDTDVSAARLLPLPPQCAAGLVLAQ